METARDPLKLRDQTISERRLTGEAQRQFVGEGRTPGSAGILPCHPIEKRLEKDQERRVPVHDREVGIGGHPSELGAADCIRRGDAVEIDLDVQTRVQRAGDGPPLNQDPKLGQEEIFVRAGASELVVE